MTPAAEAPCIALREQGLDHAAIARHLGIPIGTASSRASTLIRQGTLPPRPRGGAYPRQQARQGTGHESVQSRAVHGALHGAETVTQVPSQMTAVVRRQASLAALATVIPPRGRGRFP